MKFFENFGGGDAKRIKAEQEAKEERDAIARANMEEILKNYEGPVGEKDSFEIDPITGLRSDGSFARKDHT